MPLFIQIIYQPTRAFGLLKKTSFFYGAMVLMLIRYAVTPINTVWGMYAHQTPSAIPPPFGMDIQTYRFYEIFWYGPYGLLMTGIIIWSLRTFCRKYYRLSEVSWQKTCEIVCLAFFTPWIPSIVFDRLLIETGNAGPQFLVPFHISILVCEMYLVAVGFHSVYGVSKWQGRILGMLSGSVFVIMGGLVIR